MLGALGWSRGAKNEREAVESGTNSSDLGKTCSLASWVDSGVTASDDSVKGYWVALVGLVQC